MSIVEKIVDKTRKMDKVRNKKKFAAVGKKNSSPSTSSPNLRPLVIITALSQVSSHAQRNPAKSRNNSKGHTNPL
jgi:hypothetical protein